MIPLILGAAALATGAVGVTKGAEGIGKIKQAQAIGEDAQVRYERHLRELEVVWENTNKSAETYGQIQLRIKQSTISRFITFIERIGQRASQNEMEFLAGLNISTQQIKEYKNTVIEAQEFARGGISAAIAGAAAGSSAITLARSFGTVTVTKFFGLWTAEVAISQLGGAAARGAALSWFAGGGSTLAGGAVLGGVTLGPALMVGGFQLAGKGEEALTKAREYEAKVNVEITNIETGKDFLLQVKQRIKELAELLCNLNTRADLFIKELEALPSFDKNEDALKFQQAALLVKALAEIMKTHILDSEGYLNSETLSIQARYATLGELQAKKANKVSNISESHLPQVNTQKLDDFLL
ncbi:MAG: hypothetical protein KME29_16595 [Calothrix sp. FI2-JRJ7]|jgi:hypothetical protein|nr:hypothetical protein [Calothrix sp. FI2-JRJ7]